MNWSSGFHWLTALANGGGGARSGEVDRGDMGTAFGLDASFEAVDEAGAEGFSTSTGSVPWEHRITRRSGL